MYANGEIPLSVLQHLGGEHYLPAGTAARWLWLVRAAKEKYGVTLRITPGPNAYLWRAAQIDAKAEACAAGRCQDAADPGSSSHGGVYDGQECMAIDVYNWADLTADEGQAWARFVALCRLAGFTVLLFDWAVIVSTPSEEDIMAGPIYINETEGRLRRAVLDVSVGVFTPRNGGEAEVASALFGGKDVSTAQFDIAANLALGLHDQFIAAVVKAANPKA